ncbi:TPA: hypothetical protein I8303_004185 [Aeromonas hydrophila]|jgi:hypothetical protein|nr:hypothetical protein [Aeromonas hydrophila]HAT3533953.1 hypothetical protein [Aeromonas hydrophila]
MGKKQSQDFDPVLVITDSDGIHLDCVCHSDVYFTYEVNAGGFLFECQECGRLYHSGTPSSPEEIERVQGLLTATNIEN